MENEEIVAEEIGIQLDEEFWLHWDACGYHLAYISYGEVNPKTGKPIKSEQISYHATLEQVLKKYADISLKHSESVMDLKARLEELFAKIDAITVNLRRKQDGTY